MDEQHKGIVITTLAVLLVTPDSLFVRLIDADPMVIAAWRGMTSGTFVLIAVLLLQGTSGFRAVLSAGWRAWTYIALIGSTTFAFVMAVSLTSVANAVFIFAAMPVFALLFGRLLLGEPIRARMVWTMMAVFGGLGIIAYGSTESSIATWQGDLLALYVAAAYALALTLVRRLKGTSMIPAIPIAYIGAGLAIAAVTSPWGIFADQWPLLLLHGAFIGVATCLLTIGPRYISAAEVSLLILLESVLAPILVWAVIGEFPGSWAIAGGAVVIGALLVSNLIALRRVRRAVLPQ